MYAEEEQLRYFLLDAGIVSRSQIDEAVAIAENTDTPLSRVLVEQGILGEDEVRRAVAQGLGIPFIRLTSANISDEALAIIPESLARARGMIAFALQDKTLEVALLDISDLEALEPLGLHTKYTIVPRLTDRESITRALLQYQKNLKELFGARIAHEAANMAPLTTADDYAVVAERLPVRGLVDAIVGHALYQHAHAVYIEPRGERALIRYRIGAEIYDAMHIPKSAAESVIIRFKALAHLKLDTSLPQEGRFRVGVGEEEYVSVHVSVVPIAGEWKEKLALHLMHERTGRRGFTLESLGFSTAARHEVHTTLASGRGLVLVCGPAQSGKTTLLYTLLDMLSGVGKSLASVEERVELYLPFVAQTVVSERVGLSYAAALRAVLRQDPHVVMIADVRDAETALLAVEAANRGVLVLAGIEASSAAGGVQAFASLGVSPKKLAASFRAAIGVRVVRKLCAHNRAPQRLTREEVDMLESKADFARILNMLKEDHKVDPHVLWKDVAFFHAEPCVECRGGYSGTFGLQEVLPTSQMLKDCIEKEEPAEALEAAARADGMYTIIEDGIVKAAQAHTTIEEVLGVAGEL